MIRSNDQRSALTELTALRSVGGDLQIERNDMLCADVADALCLQLGSGLVGDCLIADNDGACH